MQPPPAQNRRRKRAPPRRRPRRTARPTSSRSAGYPEQNKRKMQIFELDGYLRLRDDYMHDFFLGLGYSNVAERLDGRQAPRPTACRRFRCRSTARRPRTAPASRSPTLAGNPGQNCATKNIGGANLRLRLEPTLNVTDQVRIHAQIDVLDNTIMGSTPDSLAGIQGFNTPPATPVNGQQSRRPRCPASRPPGSCPRPRIRPRSARTASPPASAPSAPGPRSTPSSARSASAACPGTGAAASSTTTGAAPTATSAPPSIG